MFHVGHHAFLLFGRQVGKGISTDIVRGRLVGSMKESTTRSRGSHSSRYNILRDKGIPSRDCHRKAKHKNKGCRVHCSNGYNSPCRVQFLPNVNRSNPLLDHGRVRSLLGFQLLVLLELECELDSTVVADLPSFGGFGHCRFIFCQLTTKQEKAHHLAVRDNAQNDHLTAHFSDVTREFCRPPLLTGKDAKRRQGSPIPTHIIHFWNNLQ